MHYQPEDELEDDLIGQAVGNFSPDDKSAAAIPMSQSAAMGLSTGNKIGTFTAVEAKHLDVEPIADGILSICSELYFRQSMLKDYLTCPMLMLYKWIIGHEEEDTFFASILGTAGHSVIELMHQEKNVKSFTYTTIDLGTLFVEFGNKALASSSVPPRLSAKYPTIKAQLNAVALEYVQMLQGYAKDPRNHGFHATVNEQLFVLVIKSDDPRHPGTYLFTGTIDQAGFYTDGSFALRDIKFRLSQFKPGYTQLQLDLQLSLYAYALRYGYPACDVCRPSYGVEGELVYTGPCSLCSAKVGTSAWPQLIAERTELIWMRDYVPRKKDQYSKVIISDTEFEISPETKRKRKARIANPKYYEGYKAGDPTGEAIFKSFRSETFLNVRMADVLQVAHSIKTGVFFRKEGDHCNFWCKFRKPCVDMLETQVEDIDASTMNERIAVLDPFGDA